jgi:hypothetical protein
MHRKIAAAVAALVLFAGQRRNARQPALAVAFGQGCGNAPP